MARVPTYDGFQVEANTLPQVRMNAPQMHDAASRQAMQLGAEMQQAGGKLGALAMSMQQEINQVRLDDAANKAKEAMLRLTFDKETGYTMLKGNNALDRPDGASLDQEYGDKLQKELDSISSSLGNDAQRRAFQKLAGGMAASFRGDVLKHATQEYVTYSLSVAEGVQATAMREIMLNYNNPEAVDKAVLRIRGQTYRQAQLTGKSAQWQEAQNRKLTSEAHKLVVKTAMERGDLGYAEGYLTKYKDQLDGDDYLTLQGTFLKERDMRGGTAIGAAIAQDLSAQGGDAGQIFTYLLRQESGNRQFDKSGKVITSSAGALGAAQIMPSTGPEAAKLAGLPWDANRLKTDYNYNVALGRAYFNKQLKDFGGNVPMALAAYNAGPGAVRKAIKKAGDGGDWLAHLPAETRNYVPSIMSRYKAGARHTGKPTPAQVEQSLASNPALVANPRMAQYARKEAERQIKVIADTAKQEGEEAEAKAIQMLVENGGRYSDLPLSVREAIPPDKVTGVMGAAERIAKGDNATSDYLYNHLTAHPEELTAMTDAQFVSLRKELNDSDFKHFSRLRANLLGKGGEGGNGANKVNTSALNNAVNQWLHTMRLDPTPKDGSKEAAQVAGLRRFVLERVSMHQASTGKQLSEVELMQFVHAVLGERRTVYRMFSTPSVPMGLIKVGEIGDQVRRDIKAALARRGNTNPTDEEILNVYRHMK